MDMTCLAAVPHATAKPLTSCRKPEYTQYFKRSTTVNTAYNTDVHEIVQCPVPMFAALHSISVAPNEWPRGGHPELRGTIRKHVCKCGWVKTAAKMRCRDPGELPRRSSVWRCDVDGLHPVAQQPFREP